MSKTAAEQLAEELTKAIEDNNQFLDKLDKSISQADSDYAKMENQETAAYLKITKETLEQNPSLLLEKKPISNTNKYISIRPRV